jgi:hypothetical protein
MQSFYLDIQQYNEQLSEPFRSLADFLASAINTHLTSATHKIWHGSPVWFLDGNPIVGYSKQKAGMKLLFWSGVDFDEPNLKPGSGKFKDASLTLTSIQDISEEDLLRYFDKAMRIQWDYKNIVKRKGVLHRL